MRKFSIFNFQRLSNRKLCLFSIETAILAFAFYILFSIFYTTPVSAQEENIGESQITPASPLYFLKSVREVLELKFAGTPRVKAIRELEFATRRIREVKGLVNTSRQDLIEPTLYQYLSHMREFFGIANFSDQDFAAEVSTTVAGHMATLQAVYGRIADKRALMAVRVAINNLSKLELELIDKLKTAEKPQQATQLSISRLTACYFLEKEASSSALNEIEKSVFVKRASECLKPVIKP